MVWVFVMNGLLAAGRQACNRGEEIRACLYVSWRFGGFEGSHLAMAEVPTNAELLMEKEVRVAGRETPSW